MNQYQKIWDEVSNLLKEAHGYLDRENSSVNEINDNVFFEYLEHNELELAIDEIEAISGSFEVPLQFWQCLIKAANRMGLKEHSKRYVEFSGYY